MKLKNDIQVKAFLIRNKIPFEKWESYLKVDETKIGEASMAMIAPYEFKQEEVMRKRGPKRTINLKRVYREKKPPTCQLLNLEPEPEKQPENKQRPPSIYSNNPYNS